MNAARPAPTGELLGAHRLIATGEPDRARAFVARAFCPHRLDVLAGERASFDACHNHARGEILSLNYLRYGATVEIEPGELGGFYLIQIPLSGEAVIRNGPDEVRAQPRTASVLNPTLWTRMTWRAGCEKVLVQIDRRALHALAESLVGHRLRHPVLFEPAVALDRPELQRWLRRLWRCIEAAQAGRAFGQSGFRHQRLIEEALVGDFLQIQAGSLSHFFAEPPARGPEPRQLRRARACLHDRIAEPLTMSEVAAAAGCSLRSLQQGFRARFGLSPSQYLQRERLRLARHALQTAPPEVSVGAIAYEAGFTHLGRFALAYREAFGEKPSETRARIDKAGRKASPMAPGAPASADRGAASMS